MVKFLLDPPSLKAALAVIPKADMRHYLNALHFNAKQRYLEATDGLIAIRIPYKWGADIKGGLDSLLIPRDSVEQMVRHAAGHKSMPFFVQQEQNGYRACMAGGKSVLFSGLNAQFPDLGRVFETKQPAEAETMPFSLDAKLIAKWFKVQRALYRDAYLHDGLEPPAQCGNAYLFTRGEMQCAIVAGKRGDVQ